MAAGALYADAAAAEAATEVVSRAEERAQVVRAVDLPSATALTTAVLLVGVPVKAGYLLHSGRWKSIGYRRRLPAGPFGVLAVSCLALGAGLFLAFAPLTSALQQHLPHVGGYSVSRGALVIALLASLVVDGLVGPALDELYSR